MTVGVYLLSFKDKNEVYIGQSIDIERRFKQHLRELVTNKHTNYRLQEYFNMYGNPNLNILEICSSEELFKKEQIWTEEFDSVNNGLNIIEAGICGNGVNSNNSKYSKIQVLKVFIMLYKYNATRKQISDRVHVKESLAKGIACGKVHLWLKDMYPMQYSIMRNNGLKIKGGKGININRKPRPNLVDKYGNIHIVGNNLSNFILNNVELNTNFTTARQCIGDIFAGRRVQYKGYKLYDPCSV